MVPHGIIVVVLLLIGRITQAKHAAVIGNVEVLVHLKDQVAHVCDLSLIHI